MLQLIQEKQMMDSVRKGVTQKTYFILNVKSHFRFLQRWI